MRRVAVALALAGAWLLAPISAYSDTDLTSLVDQTFLARTEDASLHDIAHQRAMEISTDFSHAGIRPGTAEVLAYNGLGAGRAVEQWLGSPDHAAILLDPQWTLIGCGSHVASGVYWAVCVLTWGGSPPPQDPVPAPPAEIPPPVTVPAPPAPSGSGSASTPEPVLLPNTAMHGGR